MQLVKMIRAHGLKSRLGEPRAVISKINRVLMELTLTRRKEESDLDQFDEGSYQFL